MTIVVSTDSIPTSAGFEDHVSMGSLSAIKLAKIVDNVTRIVAVELLAGAQAMDFFKPLRGGRGSQAAFDFVRRHVPFIESDSALSEYLVKLEEVIGDGSLVRETEGVVGDLLDERKTEGS